MDMKQKISSHTVSEKYPWKPDVMATKGSSIIYVRVGSWRSWGGRGIIFTGSTLVAQMTNETRLCLVMVLYLAYICSPIALVSIVFPLMVHGRVRGLPSPPMVVTRTLSRRIHRVTNRADSIIRHATSVFMTYTMYQSFGDEHIDNLTGCSKHHNITVIVAHTSWWPL